MTRLELMDEELVEQIKEDPCLQVFIGLEACQYLAPFDASMMLYFRKRLPEAVLNDCSELIELHSLNVIRSSCSQGPGDDKCSGGGLTNPVGLLKPSSQKRANQGLFLIDAT